MIYNIQRRVYYLVDLLNSKIRVRSISWSMLISTLREYRPRLYHHIVKWDLPPVGYKKCNTDESCKGNPGLGSYDFRIRNHKRDLHYAQADTIEKMTNIQAEPRAILEVVKH